MISTILALSLFLPAGGDPPSRSSTPKKPSAIAPSLNELTDEEEEELDRVIDRFIAFDTGKLTGAEGKKALKEFEKLGPDAIPALIRGMNRAAAIEHSCPALVIAKKLHKMLSTSDDLELLEFARENIGLGVLRSQHAGILQDLRLACTFRKSAVQRKKLAAATAGPKAPRSMSMDELTTAAGSERGDRLKQVIGEVGRRGGDGAIALLGSVARATYEADVQELARDQLSRNLAKLTPAALAKKMKDDRVEVRIAAARVAGEKKHRLGSELIELLEDEEVRVREAARQALVRLSGGADYGPDAKASEKARAEAIEQWRAWWSQQKSK
jgi:hypothetical protein